ncbi:MAG TPA: aldose 1-epimerase family protein [Acidimicrobiales bacterium]|nr:aldose 1-epimerase family protein [Acidimicrobiales bacterium]
MPNLRPVEHPTGQQYELRHGSHRATVVEVGGALRIYAVDGLDVVDGYGADERCTGGRGQPLIPWPNRVADGQYRFGASDHQLHLSEPALANAIHGLVRWANWTAVDQADDRVVMAHLLHPQPGYPFCLDLRLAYSLSDVGLTVAIVATNVGDSPLPFGAGAHPYLTLGTSVVDPLVLRVPGARWIRSDKRGIPTGVEPVDGTPYDFRTPRPVGDAVLDTGYGDLQRDADGTARVELATADASRSTTLWMGPAFDWVMLFTGDTLAPAMRRRGLAVEPMTCPPNAFRSGESLLSLEPGETFSGAWGITASKQG